MQTQPQTNRRGFTIVELLVTLVIIAIVASIAIVSLMNAFERSKQRATMADMRTISKGIETYVVDHGFLPSDAGGVAGLRDVLTPYQSSVLPVEDGWGHPYAYNANVSLGDYTLVSHGKDGVAGPPITPDTQNDYTRDIILVNGQFVAYPQ